MGRKYECIIEVRGTPQPVKVGDVLEISHVQISRDITFICFKNSPILLTLETLTLCFFEVSPHLSELIWQPKEQS